MKQFYTINNVGKVKYCVCYHDGVQTHRDGSQFFAIATFKNKIKLNKFVKSLINDGYTQK